MNKKAKNLSFISILSLSILILGLIVGISLLKQVQDIRRYAMSYSAPYPTHYPPPADDEKRACKMSGGEWKTFSNSCADKCIDPIILSETVCLEVLTDSCDCGPKKCWTGWRCVPDSQYPKPTVFLSPTKPPITLSPHPTKPITITPTPSDFPSPTPPACSSIKGDTNNDGKVNVSDILAIVRYFGAPVEEHPCLDLNDDGIINVVDLLVVIREFTSK